MKFNPEDLVTQTTAGKIRGVSTQAIVSLVQRGRLTSIVIDGHTFVLRKEIESFKPSAAGRPKRKQSAKKTK